MRNEAQREIKRPADCFRLKRNGEHIGELNARPLGSTGKHVWPMVTISRHGRVQRKVYQGPLKASSDLRSDRIFPEHAKKSPQPLNVVPILPMAFKILTFPLTFILSDEHKAGFNS